MRNTYYRKEFCMKKFIVFSLALVITIVISTPIFAEEGNTSTVKPTNREGIIDIRNTGMQERKEINQAQTMERLRTKANKEIERRIESLQKLITKINSVKRLTDSQRTTMVTQVQSEITNLTTLKSKIASDTTIDEIRTDVQSIVKSYRIYVLYIPKMTIIANADKILNLLSGEMNTLTAKLQVRINELSANGVDVATINGLMAERKLKLDDAAAQAQKAIDTVIDLTPEGWPENKTQLQSARDMLAAARKDINDAIKVRNQIRVRFVELKPTGVPKSLITPKPTETEE